MDNQFTTIVDEAVVGLKDDPELCLDVRAELAGHLESAVEEHRTEGKSEEESRELAARAFGSPVEVAGALLEANRPRLRQRALLRLTVRALLIPAALLLALWCVFGRVWHNWDLIRYNPFNATGQSPSAVVPTLAPGKGMSVAQAREFLAQTDNNSGSLKSFWEAHRNEPESRIYYARYAVMSYQMLNSIKDLTNFERAMYLGEQLDPDNGLYNFYLATAYLHKGMMARTEKNLPKGEIGTDDLLDRAYFEKGLAEWRKGLAKPRFTAYALEMTQKRLAVLPQPRFIEDYIWRIGITSTVLFPELAKTRELARQIGGSARLLAAQGRRDEAEALAGTWQPFTTRMTGGAFTLIHVLVVNAVTEIMSSEAAELYGQLGRPDLAAQTRERAQQFTAEINTWKAHRAGPATKEQLAKYGSKFGELLLSGMGDLPPSHEQLAPTRTLEHTLLEEATVLLLLGNLAMLMLGSVIQAALCSVRLRGARSTPLLLLPPAPVFVRIFTYGVALPLACYFIYTHLPVIGGREYAVSYMWPRFVAEALALLLLLWLLPTALANRYIRRRCRDLGVSIPDSPKERRAARKSLVAGLLCTVIMGIFAVLLLKLLSDGLITLTQFSIIAVISLAAVCYLLLLSWKRITEEHALYNGTIARSQAAIYALTIILIAAVPQPYLRYCEINALQRDQLVFPHSGVMLTPTEDRTVQRFRMGMLQVAEKWSEKDR